jgi:hypothetical protein
MMKSKCARKPTPRNRRRHTGDPRAGVDMAALVCCLHDHAMGRRMLKPTQQRAAEIVLDKLLPDLAPSKAGAGSPDQQRLAQYAAHRERSDWHAAHRAKRQRTAESSAKAAVAAGAEEDISRAIRRR